MTLAEWIIHETEGSLSDTYHHSTGIDSVLNRVQYILSCWKLRKEETHFVSYKNGNPFEAPRQAMERYARFVKRSQQYDWYLVPKRVPRTYILKTLAGDMR